MRYTLGTLTIMALLLALMATACSSSGEDSGTKSNTESAVSEESKKNGDSEPAKKLVTPTPEPQLEFGEAVIAEEGERSTEVPLLTPVSLKIGQKMASPDLVSGLTIDFVEVLEDTRCDLRFNCTLWGKIVVKVRLASNVTDLGEAEMTIVDGTSEPTIQKIGNFSVAFISIKPDVIQGEATDPSEYRATFAVLKQ